MAAPATGEVNSRQERSDLHHPSDQFKSVDVNLTISQLFKTQTPPPRFNPSSGKQRKTKLMGHGVSQSAIQKKPPPTKLKIVMRDRSNIDLRYSSQEESSSTKNLKSLAKYSAAMLRAEEIQSRLGTEHPSFIKLIVRSHITTGCWMGLPLRFCKLHLPKTDANVELEDENGGRFDVKYIAYKNGLSAGWKKFAVAHNLLEGDVLVFQLVKPCKLKVYILETNDLDKVDAAFPLSSVEAHTEDLTPERNTEAAMPSTTKTKKSNIHAIEPSCNNDSEEFGSEVVQGSIPTKPHPSFQDVKAFEDFSIMVNGRCTDSELPDTVRMGYYKLCLAKKEFLHDRIPPQRSYMLVAGMIAETVLIANALRNCNVNTTKEELEAWDNSLESFDLLGMKVDFLRDRVKVLVKVIESEGGLDAKRYAEAKREHKRVQDELKKVKEKLVELKEVSKKLKGEVDVLKEKAESYELKFKQQQCAQW